MKCLPVIIAIFHLISCTQQRAANEETRHNIHEKEASMHLPLPEVSEEEALRNVHEIIILMAHPQGGYLLQTSLIQKKEEVDYIINLIQNNRTDTLKTGSETLKYDLAGNLPVDFITIVIPTDGGNHYKLHLTTDEIDTIIRLARRNRISIRSSADNNTY